jgi:hypothetical protein
MMKASEFSTHPSAESAASVATLKSRFETAVPMKTQTNADYLVEQGVSPHNDAMDSPTREEFDLHIRHLDDRLEGHFKLLDERLNSQNALYTQWRDGQAKLLDERDHRLEKAIGDIKTEASIARAETRAESRSLRTVIITTAIGTVIAIVGGIAAFNATVLSNMLASFESGKNTATAVAQAGDALQKTQDQLKEAVEKIQKIQPAPNR